MIAPIPPPAAPPPSPAGASSALRDESPEQAWIRHEAAIRAIPTKAELTGRADLVALAGAVRSVVPQAERYADAMLALPGFDPSWLHELSSLASALLWLAVEGRVVGEGRGSVQALLSAVAAERRRLVTVAAAKAALARLPSIDAAVSVPGKRASDYAVSLQATVALLHRLGLEHTPLTLADLDAADALALRLLAVNDPRQRAPAERGELRQLQRKALALLMAAYGEVRAAVLYVGRDDPGIEDVVPALWSLRGERVGRRR